MPSGLEAVTLEQLKQIVSSFSNSQSDSGGTFNLSGRISGSSRSSTVSIGSSSSTEDFIVNGNSIQVNKNGFYKFIGTAIFSTSGGNRYEVDGSGNLLFNGQNIASASVLSKNKPVTVSINTVLYLESGQYSFIISGRVDGDDRYSYYLNVSSTLTIQTNKSGTDQS